jgi:hypothetical protein
MRGTSAHFTLEWNETFWQTHKAHGSIGNDSELMQSAPIQLAPSSSHLNKSVLSGDLLCSCLEDFGIGGLWLWLRLSDPIGQCYTLVGIKEPYYLLPTPFGAKIPRMFDRKLRTCPKIKVRVI